MVRLPAWLPILWSIAIAWSLVSLIAYRSSEYHGPDMVGQEVSGFILPLLIALGIGIVVLFGSRTRDLHPTTRWASAPLATIAIGICEVLVYCTFIMR